MNNSSISDQYKALALYECNVLHANSGMQQHTVASPVQLDLGCLRQLTVMSAHSHATCVDCSHYDSTKGTMR